MFTKENQKCRTMLEHDMHLLSILEICICKVMGVDMLYYIIV